MHKQDRSFTNNFFCDVLLVTVTSVETRAVLSACQQVTNRTATTRVLHQKTYYDLHEIAGVRIFLVESEMGSRSPDGSTLTILTAIKTLEPRAVIMVGVAFGLKPEIQQLGDILVSSHLRDYEELRVGARPDGSMYMHARGERPRASSWLMDRCRAVRLKWTGPAIHIGLLLSGDKLVDHSAFLTQLYALEPEAIGGEMEAVGLYAAAYRERVDWIVVKGISDWANGSKRDQKEALQHLAATNAAQFVVAVLQQETLAPTFPQYEQEKPRREDLSGEKTQIDWGNAPHIRRFYGRKRVLTKLKRWIKDHYCQVVAVVGMGGIGKTSLTVTLADRIQDDFEYIFWCSLQNAPPLQTILLNCIQFISHQQSVDLPAEVDDQIALLLHHLFQKRCLVVLDNFESILQVGKPVGSYREGYEGYGKLLRRVGEAQHRSCLLLTSREKPKEIAFLESKTSSVRSYQLEGLEQSEGRALLKDKGIYGGEAVWEALIACYGGNPLALKLVSQFIREVFSGDIIAFLKEGEIFFSDIQDVLEQQVERLSALEGEIIYWLAIEREAVSLDALEENMVHSTSKGVLQEALRSLRRRQLIETRAMGFTLHSVIMEYLTNRLVNQIYEEIRIGTRGLFEQYALLKAQAKDYIRRSQRCLILQPLLQRLLTFFTREELERQFQSILSNLRNMHNQRSVYAAGNILNLLIELGCELRGYDFSHLVVWQAYLQGVALPEVNFGYADLARSVFTDTFGSIISVAFSPQGDLLAAGTAPNEIRLWYAPSGLPMQTIQGHTNEVRSVVFNPDGTILASCSDDQTVRLWEVSSGQCLAILRGHTHRVWSVVFSPDGMLLASGSEDQTVRLWEVSSGQCLAILRGHTHRVWSVVFSPDGKILASGSGDQTVHLWEVSSGRCLPTLLKHSHRVRSVAFSPDGMLLASGSEDQAIRLWEVSSGQCLAILRGHTNRVRSVAFSPDGALLASGSDDQTVRLWEVSSGQCLSTLLGHTDEVESVAFSPDGKTLVSGGYDQAVRLWEVSSGRCLTNLLGHTHRVESLTFGPDGTILVSGGSDQTVRLWEVSSGRCLTTLRGHTGWVWSVAFNPNGTLLASSGSDQMIRLWEVRSGRCLTTLRGHTGWVWSVAFSPDGTLLASSSSDQTIRLWEVSSGRCLTTLRGHTGWVWSVAFSPDGTLLASGSEDKTVRLWEVNSSDCLTTLRGHVGWVWSVTFSPDGALLASGSEDKTVRLWEVKSARSLFTLLGHTEGVWSVAFNPNGTTLVSGGFDQAVRSWEVSSGRCLHALSGHTDHVRSVAFSPDRKTLASGSYSGAISLWDLQTGACLQTFSSERPYERMNITKAKGLTEARKVALKLLGAIEDEG